MRSPFIRPPSLVLHPLLEKIILLAPGRNCVLAFLGQNDFLPEEEQLQQNGCELFQMMVADLPTVHRERGNHLEAHFRPLLNAAMEMLMALPDMQENTSGTHYAQAYIAVQNLIGAQKAAMSMYCRA
ncbi:hypothetical protein [Acetobacter pasteurianus]|uniref:hypothetical protein n=1 Tax=Acetobacter pasteurianus TaxID=438 RepID=UPI001E5B9788|nr:hypothetical protein [Acetobacter pasteurianus]